MGFGLFRIRVFLPLGTPAPAPPTPASRARARMRTAAYPTPVSDAAALPCVCVLVHHSRLRSLPRPHPVAPRSTLGTRERCGARPRALGIQLGMLPLQRVSTSLASGDRPLRRRTAVTLRSRRTQRKYGPLVPRHASPGLPLSPPSWSSVTASFALGPTGGTTHICLWIRGSLCVLGR